MKNYGKVLKKLRTDSDMTQAKLAERLNVTYQTVSKWENNVNTPDISVLEVICNVFGVTVDEFLHMAEENDGRSADAETDATKESATKESATIAGAGELAAETEPVKPNFCPKCGAKIGKRYCPKCGYDIVEKRTAEERGIAPDVAEENSGEKPPERKRMSKGKLAVIISVAAVGFIAVVLAIVLPIVLLKPFNKTPDSTSTSTPTPTQVVIKFDSGGGSGSMANAQVMTGDKYQIPACAFTRVGYEFDYWKSAGKNFYTGSWTRFSDGKATVTMTAVWKPITYTMDIEFNCNTTVNFDGKDLNGYVYSIKCSYGVDPLAADNRKNPTRYGFSFDGFTVYDGDGNLYDGDLRYINADPKKKPRAVMNWRSGIYDIVLYDEKHGNMVETISDCLGKIEYTLPTAAELFGDGYKPGYVFDYWQFDIAQEDADVPQFEDGATVSDLKKYGFYYGASPDFVQLDAVWKPIEYTVIFDGNGGVGDMSELTCKYDVDCTLPENAFVKDGYIFAGWECDGAKYADGETVKNLTAENGITLTLTARWLLGYEGNGTEGSPYLISDYDGLNRLSAITREVAGMDGAHYLLSADIDCRNQPLNAVFGYGGTGFGGVFDGGHHVIKNAVFAPTVGCHSSWYTEGQYIYKGLFGLVYGGEIKNIGIENYSIDADGGDFRIAPLCGFYKSEKPIKECYAIGSITADDLFTAYATVSGLVGYLSGSVENCYSKGTVNLVYTRTTGEWYINELYVGGFVADNESGSVQNCYSDVDIDVNIADSISGMFVRLYCAPFYARIGVVKNCFSTGSVHVNRYYDSSGNKIMFDSVGTFGAYDDHYSEKIENVYTSDTAAVTFDDEPEFVGVVLDEQKTATLAELKSLDYLVGNVGFDGNVWAEATDSLPTLKNFAAA